jgi:hypothetical protein
LPLLLLDGLDRGPRLAQTQPLGAAMYGEKIRGGNRGGHDRFNWDDVKNDKFRCASIDPCPCAHR